MTERQKSIDKIKKAFENKELGYQRGAMTARYYDKRSDSCCAVGVLMDLNNEDLFDDNGNVNYPFTGIDSYGIKYAMTDAEIDTLFGLTKDELGTLQHNHDMCLSHAKSSALPLHEQRFKDHLYSLT